MKTLLAIKFRQLVHGIGRGRKGKWLLFALLGVGFLAVLGFFALKVFGFLHGRGEFPQYLKLFLAEKMLLMVFLTFFTLQVLSALIASLEVFFLSRDLSLLLATPLRSRTIFLSKTIETFAISSAMVIFFCMPILYAYCRYFAPSLGQVLQVALAFLLFTACGALLGMILGLLIPALFSVRRMQVILSVVSVILISAAVVFIRLSSPERLLNPAEMSEVFNYMGSLKVRFFGFFPFHWLARAITFTAEEQGAPFLGMLALLAGLASTLLLAGLVLERRLFLSVYDRMVREGGARHRSKWRESPGGRGFSALWQKETKTFFRTPSQWSQLLVIAALLAVFVINLKMIPIPQESAQSVRTIVSLINVGLVVFMVAGLNSRFTLPAVPGEGPGLVHLAASPFPRRRYYHFKLLFYLVPHLVIGGVLFLAAHLVLRFDSFTLLLGLWFLLPAVVLLTQMAIYFGLQIKELAPVSPQHVVVSQKGISFMLWSMIYFVFCAVYLVRPLSLHYIWPLFSMKVPYLELGLWISGFVALHAILILFLYVRSKRIWLEREF